MIWLELEYNDIDVCHPPFKEELEKAGGHVLDIDSISEEKSYVNNTIKSNIESEQTDKTNTST